MIDFHSHVLPRIDDGASSVEMSLNMLADSYKQGIRTIVATPHCYLMKDSNIDTFLNKRQASYESLLKAMESDERTFPQIRLGCELRIMKEINDMRALDKLRIEGTDYIMVEMPFKEWDVNYYDFLYEMILRGMRPIMAHIERFWNHRKEFYNLYSLDLIYQVNAESIVKSPYKRYIPKLFEEGAVNILGSDMHNMTTRSSLMKKAADTIVRVYGEDRLNYLMKNAENILGNKKVEGRKFPKMSFFKTLKI